MESGVLVRGGKSDTDTERVVGVEEDAMRNHGHTGKRAM